MTKETQKVNYTHESYKYDGGCTFHYTVHNGLSYNVELDKVRSALVHEFIIAQCEERRRELENVDPLPKATSGLIAVHASDNSGAKNATFEEEAPF